MTKLNCFCNVFAAGHRKNSFNVHQRPIHTCKYVLEQYLNKINLIQASVSAPLIKGWWHSTTHVSYGGERRETLGVKWKQELRSTQRANYFLIIHFQSDHTRKKNKFSNESCQLGPFRRRKEEEEYISLNTSIYPSLFCLLLYVVRFHNYTLDASRKGDFFSNFYYRLKNWKISTRLPSCLRCVYINKTYLLRKSSFFRAKKMGDYLFFPKKPNSLCVFTYCTYVRFLWLVHLFLIRNVLYGTLLVWSGLSISFKYKGSHLNVYCTRITVCITLEFLTRRKMKNTFDTMNR